MDRGKIRNREQAQQIRDFSGLRWGSITPTDIDGFFEMQNVLFVFIEIKFKDAALPVGQRLALERVVDILERQKKAILILARHESQPSEDIDCANCLVTGYYFRRLWHKPRLEMGLKDFCDWFIDYAKSANQEVPNVHQRS